MATVVIILFIILFIASWVLFVPLVIDLDTARSVYRVYQTGTFRFWLGKDFQPRLRVFGIVVSLKQQNETRPAKPPKKKKGKKISLHHIGKLIRKIVQSIHIKRFQVDIDTDDVVVNAKLVPLLAFLNRGPVHLSANFEGRMYASLLAEVRLYRLAWAFIQFFTKQ